MLKNVTAVSFALTVALAAYATGIQSTGNAALVPEFSAVIIAAVILGLVAVSGVALLFVKTLNPSA